MGRRDRGTATAEFAVALPAFVAVLVVALAGVATGIDHVRCVDAARSAARALARGDSPAAAMAVARAAAPGGAQVVTSVTSGTVTVRVTSTRAAPGTVFRWRVEAVAAADLETVPP